MWVAIVSLLFLSFSLANGDVPIGGCAGTRYGCCPDGVTSSRGLAFYGCRQRHVAPSAECRNFLAKLHPGKCATRTSCLDMECNYTIQGIRLEMEFDVHKCREPPSVNMTLIMPDQRFTWSHDFSGNVSVIVPNLEITLSVFNGLRIHVLVDVSVYSSNRDIRMSAAVEPSLPLAPQSDLSIYRMTLLEDSKLPINTSDCYGPPSCPTDCLNCFNGDDGWVCYQCPLSCAVSRVSHWVCGSDMVSYSSECDMRVSACGTKTPLRVLYTGRCSSNPPTQLSLLTAWPQSIDNLSSNTEAFIRGAVVFLVVSVNESLVLTYTPKYFRNKLSLLLKYQVVVPRVRRIDRSRQLADDTVILNVTMYAHYHTTGGDDEVIVPNVELLDALKRSKAEVEKTVDILIVSINRSYSFQMSSDTGSGSSYKTAVIAVVSVLVGFLVVAIVVFVVIYQRKKSCENEGLKEDVVYLPEQDQLASESSTDYDLASSKGIQ